MPLRSRVLLLVSVAGCAEPLPPCLDTPVPDSDGGWQILWAGDTLLADAARPMLEKRGYDLPFAHVAGRIAAADYAVVNLEGPITERTEPRDPEPHDPSSAPGGFGAASVPVLTDGDEEES